jgi:hypothetical protein
MCALCAAIPATLALGAVDQANRRRSDVSAQGRNPARRLRPISSRSALLVAALAFAAAVYHTRFLAA